MAKVFISFLGTGGYQETTYQMPNGFQKKTKFVQIGILASLKEEKFWQEGTDNRIHILLTKEAEEKHWPDLKKQIEDLGNINAEMKPIMNINSKDIMKQIESIINTVNQNDEVYFDITHGFRSLPFAAMVALNYLSIIKNVSVNKLFYGDFGNPIDPIHDITQLIELQQWTFAARDFAEFGSTKSIEKLTKQKIRQSESTLSKKLKRNLGGLPNKLNDISSLFYTCRGPSIIENVLINNTIEFLKPKNFPDMNMPHIEEVLNYISNKIQHLESKNPITLTENSIEWCIQHNLTQQGFTLLQEFFVFLILKKWELNESKIYHSDMIKSILSYSISNTSELKIEFRNFCGDYQSLAKKGIDLQDYYYKYFKPICDFLLLNTNIITTYNNITGHRNNINHAGFGKNTKIDFSEELEDCWKKIKPFLEELEQYKIPEVVLPEATEPQLFLLFNHNLTNSQVTAVHQDLNVNSIVPLPDELKTLWGNIPPEAEQLDLEPLETWLNTESHYGDYVLIQGDMGACYHMVEWCMLRGLQPIYATSERKVTEITDGDQVIKQAVFEHVRFRHYSKPTN